MEIADVSSAPSEESKHECVCAEPPAKEKTSRLRNMEADNTPHARNCSVVAFSKSLQRTALHTAHMKIKLSFALLEQSVNIAAGFSGDCVPPSCPEYTLACTMIRPIGQSS